MGSDIPNDAGVCFHEKRRRFYQRCRDKHENACHIGYGRCRSGQRWFWSAHLWSRPGSGFLDNPEWLFGWEDTEQQALEAARGAVIRLAAGDKALAIYVASYASDKLKELNSAKRAARPAPRTSDTCATEYLYGGYLYYSDGPWPAEWHFYRYRITKRTKKRVFYVRDKEQIDARGAPTRAYTGTFGEPEIGFVDRQKLEGEGYVNTSRDWRVEQTLYASLDGLLTHIRRHEITAEEQLDLSTLKAEMAAAHPDRGGSNTAFIAARARYVSARRRMRVAAP